MLGEEWHWELRGVDTSEKTILTAQEGRVCSATINIPRCCYTSHSCCIYSYSDSSDSYFSDTVSEYCK